MNNPKADAALYLITGLLQRIENQEPGTLQEMINGVKSDRDALPENTENRAHVEAIFDETLKLLERANNV